MATFENANGRPIRTTLKWWSVRNFKALTHAETPLDGLTALTGSNSAGKSSLLQSILLVAQSVDQEVTLNGSLVRLGVPRDVIKSGSSSLSIACIATMGSGADAVDYSIDLTLRATITGLRVSELVVTRDDETVLLATDDRVTERTRAQVDPDAAFGDTMLRVREVDGRPAPSHTYVSFIGFAPNALHARPESKLILRDLRRVFTPSALRDDPDIANQFTELVFSNFYRTRTDREPGPLTDAIRTVVSGGLFENETHKTIPKATLDVLLAALASHDDQVEWQRTPIRGGTSTPQRRATRQIALVMPSLGSVFRALLAVSAIVARVGQTTRYLGPLREEPQVVSKSATRSRLSPVGIRGELTAELLHTRTAPVIYSDWDRTPQRGSLEAAVSMWSARLGIGEQVTVEDQGKLGRGLRVNMNGVARDLTTIGVGASQLLPVITAVLDAPPQSLVLLEQPELHLHPSVQSRLADFLLFSRPDISVIVETHSEYLITRLRRSVAEKKATPGQIHILFAEPTPDGTEVRRLKLTDLGNLDDWPSGFFDSHDEEAHAIVNAIAGRRSES